MHAHLSLLLNGLVIIKSTKHSSSVFSASRELIQHHREDEWPVLRVQWKPQAYEPEFESEHKKMYSPSFIIFKVSPSYSMAWLGHHFPCIYLYCRTQVMCHVTSGTAAHRRKQTYHNQNNQTQCNLHKDLL